MGSLELQRAEQTFLRSLTQVVCQRQMHRIQSVGKVHQRPFLAKGKLRGKESLWYLDMGPDVYFIPKEASMYTTRGVLSLFFRLLKIFGCPHGCVMQQPSLLQQQQHQQQQQQQQASFEGSQAPNGAGGGVKPCPNLEAQRTKAISLLSRLLWYDKAQFKRFICILVNTRDIAFLLSFFHAYLGFCVDPTSTATGGTLGSGGASFGPSGMMNSNVGPNHYNNSPTGSSANPGMAFKGPNLVFLHFEWFHFLFRE